MAQRHPAAILTHFATLPDPQRGTQSRSVIVRLAIIKPRSEQLSPCYFHCNRYSDNNIGVYLYPKLTPSKS